MLIGILTGGGDCPGLNAVIRAAVKTAAGYGWQTLGIEEGFRGLVQRKARALGPAEVSGILQLGGTILGTTNAGDPFRYPVREGDSVVERDVSAAALENFRALGLDALVVVGGDGTLRIAQAFHEKGMPLVGIPKTIDNDLGSTIITFGFDTAVNTACDALDKLHTTAESHRRVIVVEMMGRYAGWIALQSGVAGGADVILIPEIPFRIESVVCKIVERERQQKKFSIVVVAEGAAPAGGEALHTGERKPGHDPRLGGIAQKVASDIERLTGKETRVVVLGHLQRGGAPTTFDRVLGTRFGAAAIRLVRDRRFGHMVSLLPPDVASVPICEAIATSKLVPLDSDIVLSARGIGICFGD